MVITCLEKQNKNQSKIHVENKLQKKSHLLYMLKVALCIHNLANFFSNLKYLRLELSSLTFIPHQVINKKSGCKLIIITKVLYLSWGPLVNMPSQVGKKAVGKNTQVCNESPSLRWALNWLHNGLHCFLGAASTGCSVRGSAHSQGYCWFTHFPADPSPSTHLWSCTSLYPYSLNIRLLNMHLG